MDNNSENNTNWTFKSLFILYFMLYFCIGILPVNIDNLVADLPGTTEFGIGIIIVIQLSVGTFSLLFFGYYGEKISKIISRKRLFNCTNLIWVLSYGLNVVAPNYQYYLFFMILASIGSGAFLPLGFSIIGDLFPPQRTGKQIWNNDFWIKLRFWDGIITWGLIRSLYWT
ncbi:MAG: MFS transporter [Promethearchaeota archaeon]